MKKKGPVSPPNPAVFFSEARRSFHAALLENVLRTDSHRVPTNADVGNAVSIAIAKGILARLGAEVIGARLAGQMSGNQFEAIVCRFLSSTFPRLHHLRPGEWHISQIGPRNRMAIARFEQYSHLIALDNAAKKDAALAAALGNDYTITPDVVIIRDPVPDDTINQSEQLVSDGVARLTSLRSANGAAPILHASISCKWTIRSDRVQNARSEALNLIRNRKGRLPHVCVVTGEPLPSRLAAIALGTGDIDCVYHFALPELRDTLTEAKYQEAAEILRIMTEGKRLRDIADLPLDLAI